MARRDLGNPASPVDRTHMERPLKAQNSKEYFPLKEARRGNLHITVLAVFNVTPLKKKSKPFHE